MILISLALAAAAPNEAAASVPPMKCELGPLNRSFGGTKWLTYACDDGRSVVIVADKGNPAGSFYFLFAAKKAGYQLIGEGNGDKAASDAAYEELRKLDSTGVAKLHSEATAAVKASS